MENKKLGVIFLVLGVALTILILNLVGNLNKEAVKIGCFENKNCEKIESKLDIVHLAFGIIGFVLALGVYLIIFSKSDEAILHRLEEEKKERSDDEKFNLIMHGLDEYEKNVMKAIKEQNGITQNTLRLRTNLSKAKLSYVVNDLEKKGLIKREKNGKTFAIFLRV